MMPDYHERNVRNLSDFTPPRVEVIASATARTSSEIRALTFHHLVQNLGRASGSQPQSKFLSGSVDTYLRYCPICLEERGYRSLLWRFSDLQVCKEHQVALLDQCPHCMERIPLFPNTLDMFCCPNCGGNLSHIECEYTAPDELAYSTELSELLELLLVPSELQSAGLSQQLAMNIGSRLQRIRKVIGITRDDIRKHAGVMPYHSLGIENADPERGALFHEYLAYADYLNERMLEQYPSISLMLDHETGAGLLCRVVEDALCDTNNLYNQIATTVERVKRQTNKYRESVLLQGVFDASIDIYEEDKAVSQRAVARYLNISRRKLRGCDGAVDLVNMINRGELTDAQEFLDSHLNL